jgi:creatinine amidohydrolase
MKGIWLENLPWPEAEAAFKAGMPVVIPIGALAKEHGHHLPLKTDYLLARGLAERLAARLAVLVAPVVGFGYYPAFVRYPGSQHLRHETFIALIRDLLDGLIDQGARHLFLLNTGVSTEAPLRLAQRDILESRGVAVAAADLRLLATATRERLFPSGGGHADAAETSLLLALAPEVVDLARALPDPPAEPGLPPGFSRPSLLAGQPGNGVAQSRQGAVGDPTLASAVAGEEWLAAILADLEAGLTSIFPALAVEQ